MIIYGKHLEKHRPGCYRVPLTGERFAQIVRGSYTSSARWGDEFRRGTPHGRHWAVEIRDSDSGQMMRYAGVWPTLREAVESILSEVTP